MRALLVVLAFAFTFSALAADDPRIAEGVALHDAGKYDEAIARYNAVLADDPANASAAYELTLTLQTKGDAAQCRAVASKFAGTPGPLQAGFLTTLGSCLDMQGEGAAAIDAFRKALTIKPNDVMVLFNLGVTLTARQQYSEAREVLKKELQLRPGHGSGHYVLGQVFAAENFRVPAVLSLLRFLAIEPSSARSKDAATRLLALLNAGVEKTGEKNINLTVDPSSPKEEGDFGPMEMTLALVSGARFLEKNDRKSEFDVVREQVASTLAIITEMAGDSRGNHTATVNLPFFLTLSQEKMLETFAGVAISSLGLKGGDKWAKKNDRKIKELAQFMQEQPR